MNRPSLRHAEFRAASSPVASMASGPRRSNAMRVFVPFPDDFDELERELARLPLVPYRPGVALASAGVEVVAEHQTALAACFVVDDLDVEALAFQHDHRSAGRAAGKDRRERGENEQARELHRAQALSWRFKRSVWWRSISATSTAKSR